MPSREAPAGADSSLASDERLRTLLGALTPHPQAAAWLAGERLAEDVAEVINRLAQGRAPRLVAFAPHRPFRVRKTEAGMVIDARTFARYDGLADAFGSLDTRACAAAFRQLEPDLHPIFEKVAPQAGGLRFAMARGIGSLLATPEPGGDLAVVARVHMGLADPALPESATLVYEFVDRATESLTPAQKQLLRLGPRNSRLVKDKLRELATALDLPVATP